MPFWQDAAQTGTLGLVPVAPPWRQAQRPLQGMFVSLTWLSCCLLPLLSFPVPEKQSGGRAARGEPANTLRLVDIPPQTASLGIFAWTHLYSGGC